MNAKKLAELITGREYPFRLSMDEQRDVKTSGLVVVYGHSDDLMMFDGAINDDEGCWTGGTVYLTNQGLLRNQCLDYDCPYFTKAKKKAATIEAIWNRDRKYTGWVYETEIPHETFDVMEDGEFYCKGIVFSLKDVKPIAGAL